MSMDDVYGWGVMMAIVFVYVVIETPVSWATSRWKRFRGR